MVQLFVIRPNGQALNVAADASDDVACLYAAVERYDGIDASEQRLEYAGKPLVRGALRDYGLCEGSSVHLSLRLPGGALLGKTYKGHARKEGELEQRYARLKEFDAQNQKYLAARNQLKARMEQEKANSHMNQLKIQNQWRKIMRLAKVESLRKDIEILSQNHERDVDRKDAIIQMLDRDLEEAEDQFQMALRSHLQNMDKLIDLQDTRLLALEQEFEAELTSLETEFDAEKDMITAQHAKEAQELNDIMAAVNAEEQDRESEARQEHEQWREEIRNKNLEEINMLRIGLDSQIEDLEQHFETAHLNYLQTTDQRTSDFKWYTNKDQELSKEIEIKIRKIERLQSSLSHWRTKFSQNVKECSQRNSLLTEEKNKIQAHFQHLKGRMNRFRGHQAKRMSSLTQNADQARSSLCSEIELAERILKLAELGRKLETEQEKVIPFYLAEAPPSGDDGANETSDAQAAEASTAAAAAAAAEDYGFEAAAAAAEGGAEAAALTASAWDENGARVQQWNRLDKFWKKFNKVLLDKLAIEREQERLQKENADLQAILKQYFDGVSVNDEVLRSDNPLFVINGRVHLNQPMPVRNASLTVVDANQHVRNLQNVGGRR